jgi:hypothetical protein
MELNGANVEFEKHISLGKGIIECWLGKYIGLCFLSFIFSIGEVPLNRYCPPRFNKGKK